MTRKKKADRKEPAMTRRARKRREEQVAADEEFRPSTPLGRRLREIRERIVASGERLLSWDEVERELAARRGERQEH